MSRLYDAINAVLGQAFLKYENGLAIHHSRPAEAELLGRGANRNYLPIEHDLRGPMSSTACGQSSYRESFSTDPRPD